MELFRQEWEEIALDKDHISLSVDVDRYSQMQALGTLHILGARDDGKLVGYYIAFLFPHPHYKDAGAMAMTDVYYLLPQYRRGGYGVTLLVEAERSLREKGITKAYISCKVQHDHTELFEHLGWTKSDFCFIKLLKD